MKQINFKGEVFLSPLFKFNGVVKQRLKMNKKYVKLDFQIERKKSGAR